MFLVGPGRYTLARMFSRDPSDHQAGRRSVHAEQVGPNDIGEPEAIVFIHQLADSVHRISAGIDDASGQTGKRRSDEDERRVSLGSSLNGDGGCLFRQRSAWIVCVHPDRRRRSRQNGG